VSWDGLKWCGYGQGQFKDCCKHKDDLRDTQQTASFWTDSGVTGFWMILLYAVYQLAGYTIYKRPSLEPGRPADCRRESKKLIGLHEVRCDTVSCHSSRSSEGKTLIFTFEAATRNSENRDLVAMLCGDRPDVHTWSHWEGLWRRDLGLVNQFYDVSCHVRPCLSSPLDNHINSETHFLFLFLMKSFTFQPSVYLSFYSRL
jgi:hypothetical protein